MQKNPLQTPPKSLHAHAGMRASGTLPGPASWSGKLDKQVLEVLAKICRVGSFTPTRRDLARHLECGYEDINASLKRLEANGSLEIKWFGKPARQAPYPSRFKVGGRWSQNKNNCSSPGGTSIDADAAPRKCMCCRELFLSEGPHNRLCVECRKTADSGLAEAYRTHI